MATPPVFSAGAVLTASQMNAVGMWLVKSDTFTNGSSSKTISNVFSSDYQNYRVVISNTRFSNNATAFKLTMSGTTGSPFYYSGWYMTTNTTMNGYNANASAYTEIAFTGLNMTSVTLDFINPNVASYSNIFSTWQSYGSNSYTGQINTWVIDTVQHTGFTLSPGAGTFSGGNIDVFGYN